jgi:propionyl-CoA carboxylase beta chain
VYSPALTDFVVMVDQTSQMFITGPDVIKTVTGEDVDHGGARRRPHPHGEVGHSHTTSPSDEEDALDYVKELLSYLPSNNRAETPRHEPSDPLVGSIEESLTAEDSSSTP